jgi:hypothetical protein
MNNLSKINPLMAWLVFLLVLTIIAIQKFNLISIPGYSQGIRFEDLTILFFAILHIQRKSTIDPKIFYGLAYLFLVMWLGFLNANTSLMFSILSYIRVLEYYILFVTIRHYLSANQLRLIVYWIFWYEVILSLVQWNSGIERAVGSTAGPWELSMMCVAAYAIITSQKQFLRSYFYNFIYLFATILVLLVSSARAQIISIILIILYRVFTSGNREQKFILIVSIPLMVAYVLNADLGYIDFSKTINFLSNYGADVVLDLVTGENLVDLSHYSYSWANDDLSLIARLHNWRNYLGVSHNAILSWVAFLFGSGPNSGGMTTDGMYIKLFVDVGLVGLVVFFIMLYRGFKNSKLVEITILIAVSSLTLDWVWASKYMYYMIVLLVYLRKNTIDNAHHNRPIDSNTNTFSS